MPPRISDETLLSELQRLANKLDRSPKQKDMEKMGDYSHSTYISHFGSWNEALNEANLEINKMCNIGKDEMMSELKRVYLNLNRVPTVYDMKEHGKYAVSTYSRYFGSWNEALSSCGFDLNMRSDISTNKLLDEIHRLFEQLNRVPTQDEMYDMGKYSVDVYQNRFGTWNNAVKEAGLEIRTHDEWVCSGCNHPDWNGGVSQNYGDCWDSFRCKTLERDNYCCQSCGISQDELDNWLCVHHIKPLNEFNIEDGDDTFEDAHDLSNLISLCIPCHMKLEGKYTDCTVSELKERI